MADDTNTQDTDDTAAASARRMPKGHVPVRITKAGDGKVSTGKRDRQTSADVHFDWKDETTLPESVARDLEARGFVEIG